MARERTARHDALSNHLVGFYNEVDKLANGCFAELSFAMSITTAVPILPRTFVVWLALGLTGYGYFRLRRRARAE